VAEERDEGLMTDPLIVSETAEEEDPEVRQKAAEEFVEGATELALDVAPVTGEIRSAQEAVESFKEGDILGTALGAAGAIPGLGMVARGAKAGIKGLRTVDKTQDKKEALELLENKSDIDAWKTKNKLPESQRQKRNPIVQQAAQDLKDGNITGKEYRKIAKAEMPMRPITRETFPEMPTLKEIVGALDKNKSDKGIVGLNLEIPDGTRVGSRLDIPAYDNYDTWVVSLHDGTVRNGKAIGYGQTAVLDNVEFFTEGQGALNIATKKPKATIARIHGDYKNEDPEVVYSRVYDLMDDPEWTQVGMNPFRHSFFYDKATGKPVTRADQVLQVGPLVLAKGARSELSDLKKLKIKSDDGKVRVFNEGGLLSPEFTEMRQGGGIETEAGKEMAKEKFQLDREKADLNNDGELSEYEKTRGEAVQRAMGEGKENKMAMGGMMADPFAPLQVTIGIDEHSGNEVPAGSKDEEVRDDIPAMLSEGEYVVPADVVRWHGLKTFEGLRCEAKHALGLMAMHDRISFVDEDTKEPVEYDIEEKEKPEVEEAEVKVIKAQEGTDVQPAPPTTFYQLRYITDPVTGRTRMAYVDPLTGQEVTREEYEEERATRFAPQRVLERDVYSPTEDVTEEEKEETEPTQCPPGQIFDSYSGKCVPFNQEGAGEGLERDTRDVPYSEQLTTLAAERLGGLGADDLKDFEGDTLAEQALSRMTDERGVSPLRGAAAALAGPLGMIGLGVKNVYDSVGAKRAAITRAGELQDIASGLDATALPQTYNLTFNPETASFTATTSSRITELQERKDGRSWASNYTHTDREGNEIDPFSSDEDFNKALDAIDAEFDSLPTTRGGGSANMYGSDELEDSNGPERSDNQGPSAGDIGDLSEEDGPEGQGYSPFAKGGMPVKKVKPKIAMLKYNKGNK
jgi:hypothetical protein